MAQKLLDRPQIPAFSKQMRRKGMPQRMWGRRGRQPQRRALLLHAQLDDSGRQNPTLLAAEQRVIFPEFIRT